MRRCTSIILLGALLGGCAGGRERVPESALEVSGARSALFAFEQLAMRQGIPRPGSALGLYTGLFLTQGIFLPVRTALRGVESQWSIIAGQQAGASDEAFALLQEYGNILSVDVRDMLNRSPDRALSLERYLQTLRSLRALAERKATELEARVETLKDERKDQRTVVRDLERTVREAMKSKDYDTASAEQQSLTEAEEKLAGIESREELTKNLLRTYEELLEIGAQRILAIEQNRAVFIAGLKVIEIPGTEDLGIIMETGRRQRRGGAFNFDPDA